MTRVNEFISTIRARLFRGTGRLASGLSSPVDAAPLAYFRFLFGAVLVWEVYRYFDHGWIARYYINPGLFFTYEGFGWLSPWPGNGMYFHFIGLGILATFVAVGLWYRISAILLSVGFWYVFLLDQANYLNHFYLVGLLSMVMAAVPAHRFASVDSLRRPGMKSRWVPRWSLWLVRFQIGVAYFFGGIAKINGDWLRGRPLDDWLSDAGDVPVIGRLMTTDLAPLVMSWSGMLLDLFIVPALLWRRTRVPAVAALVVFHLTNSALFSIGIFPWLMLLSTPVFFGTPWKLPGLPAGQAGTVAELGRTGRWVLIVFVGWQLLMPMRHLLYPGNVSWTEEGHRFSWHMKLRSKSGRVQLRARDPETGNTWEVDPGDYLSSRQERKMRTRPYLILQFAQKVEPMLIEERGVPDVEIYAKARVSLNGRSRAHMIDSLADLTQMRWGLAPSDWVLPLEPAHD
jgi:vitamin K-dependent gamma-carboxylase-like protein